MMVDPTPLRPITRIQPFAGLVIDPDTWATAHDYHRLHQQLHLLTAHGWGIARGLGLSQTEPATDTVLVASGVAIDHTGNVIVVPDVHRVTLEARDGTAYLALDYVESAPPVDSPDGAEGRGRVLEDFRIRALPSPPEPPTLELGRVAVVSAAQLAVTDAADPWMPGENEIDVRFRPALHMRPLNPVSVALVLAAPQASIDPSHLKGFSYLLRECSAAGLAASAVVAEGSVPEADLLYVVGAAGDAPTKKLITAIEQRLDSGSWLFADVCGDGAEPSGALSGLVARPGNADCATTTEASVLASYHVFGSPPAGARAAGELSWGPRMLVSTHDYGCAWGGRHDGASLPRAQIREALEFGVNVAVAASRKRASE
jgi:hypothetical protein